MKRILYSVLVIIAIALIGGVSVYLTPEKKTEKIY